MFRDKPFDTLSLSPTHLYHTDKHTSIRDKKTRTSDLHKPTRRLVNYAVLAEFSKRRAKKLPYPTIALDRKGKLFGMLHPLFQKLQRKLTQIR